jgi:hypothetical protein
LRKDSELQVGTGGLDDRERGSLSLEIALRRGEVVPSRWFGSTEYHGTLRYRHLSTGSDRHGLRGLCGLCRTEWASPLRSEPSGALEAASRGPNRPAVVWMQHGVGLYAVPLHGIEFDLADCTGQVGDQRQHGDQRQPLIDAETSRVCRAEQAAPLAVLRRRGICSSGTDRRIG